MGLKDKEILCSGYGFVGQHLVRYLVSQGAKVTVMDRNMSHTQTMPEEVKTIKGDIRHLTGDYSFDHVFHTAGVANVGYSEANPIQTFEDNVVTTLQLLKHIKIRERLVFTSSATVYGISTTPHEEDEQLSPISTYGLSKQVAEDVVKHFARLTGFEYTIVRFFNIYGEGQTKNFLIPQLIDEIRKKNEINLWNTTTIRDYIYIKDVVEGISNLALNKFAANQIVNIGSGTRTTSGEMAETIIRIFGNKARLNVKNIEQKGSHQVLVADMEKANGLDFKAKTSLEDGLRETIDAMRTE